MLSQILFLVSTEIFWMYVLLIIALYGIPTSLSGSWYLLPNNKRVIFTLVCVFNSFLLLFSILPVVNDYNTLITLPFAASGLMLVGMSPHFKDKSLQFWIHMIGAFIAGGFATAFCIYHGYWYISVITLVNFIIISIADFKNIIFWIEMGLFIPLYIVVSYLIF